MTPWQQIVAAFPDQHEPHRSVRVALLRVYSAHVNVQDELPFTVQWVARMIEEPPWSIWYGPDTALDLAKHLEALAGELRRAVFALNAASPQWQRFDDSTGAKDVVDVERPREDERQIENQGADPPF